MYNDRKPFTYLVYCKPTQQYYYGVRYSRNCHPDQLWETYFTSCKAIHRLIELYGKDQFVVSVRKVFSDPQKAVDWETRFLHKIDAANSSVWINAHNGDGKFKNKGGYKLSPQTISNMSKPKSDTHKQNISKGQLGGKKPNQSKTVTGGGNPKAKPICINGVHYSCQKEAREALGLTIHQMRVLAKEILNR